MNGYRSDSEESFLYFAYGSNLKKSEIKGTCLLAEPLAKALLPNHRLVFPRKSKNRGCGVASVQSCPGKGVWGCVYRIPESERANLYQREGCLEARDVSRNAYNAQMVEVLLDGDSEQPESALTFQANPQPNPPLPSDEYVGTIVAGACEWGIDANYISNLMKTETR